MKINLKELNVILFYNGSLDKYSYYSRFFSNIYIVDKDINVLQIYETLRKQNINIDLILHQLADDSNIEFDSYINPIREFNKNIPIIINFKNEKYLAALKNFNKNLTICYNPLYKDEILFKKIIFCIRHYKQISNLHTVNALNQKYLDIFNNVTLVSITDTKGLVTYINDKFCKETGFTRDELIGNNHNIHKHPEVRSDSYSELWNTITKGIVWQGNFKNIDKQGNTYWVKSTIFPIIENDIIKQYMCIRFLTTEEELQKKDLRKKTLNTLISNKKLIHNLKNKIKELSNNSNSPLIKNLEEQIAVLKRDLNTAKNNESNSVNNTISKFRNIQDELHLSLKKIKLLNKKIENFVSDINKKDETISMQQSKINNYTVQLRDLTVKLNNAETINIKLNREKEKKKSRF